MATAATPGIYESPPPNAVIVGSAYREESAAVAPMLLLWHSARLFFSKQFGHRAERSCGRLGLAELYCSGRIHDNMLSSGPVSTMYHS